MSKAGWWALCFSLACSDPAPPSAEDAGAAAPVHEPAQQAEPRPVSAPSARLPQAEPEPARLTLGPGESVEIPAGPLAVGSTPGSPWRDARYEADLNSVDLGGFSIDRLPYPNDPSQPPQTGVSRAEAAALCNEEGKRLCSELEWERACKGTESARTYVSGDQLDVAHCAAEPGSCASPDGVVDMGVSLAEWTSSNGNRGLGQTAIFRGAAPDSDLHQHRCAARRGAQPETRSRHIGFRCCSGTVNEAHYPTEPRVPHFRASAGEDDMIRDVMRSIPELAPYADTFRLIDNEQAERAVQRGNGRLTGWELAPGVLRWSPVQGEEAWVFSGISGEHAILAVVLPMADGAFALGGSLVLENEPVPVALAFTPPEQKMLRWGSAWGEIGESGVILYTEESRFSIELR